MIFIFAEYLCRYKNNSMISKKEFLGRIANLPHEIPSKTAIARYSGFKVEGDVLHFYRIIPRTNWRLELDVLYDIYSNNKFINTSVVKEQTAGRVNSPSVAILMAIGCIDADGNRIA